MKNYDVVITETLQRTVQIEANNRDEAEQIAKEKIIAKNISKKY